MSLLVKGEALSKLSACSPGIVPPDCELIFEVHILEADGILCAKDQCDRLPPAAVPEIGPNDFHHPWWLARVESLGISWHILAYLGIFHLGSVSSESSARYRRDMARQQASETCENFGECSLLSTAVHCSALLKVTISAAVLFEFLRSNRQRTNACDLASEVLRAVPLRSFAQEKTCFSMLQ